MGISIRDLAATPKALVPKAGSGSITGLAGVRAVSTPILVDLNDRPSKAMIVRGGKEVATPVLNPGRASQVLENFVPIVRFNEPRSVRQSVSPGTLVARGTAIDLDFLAPELVTLGIFEGVHADLQARSVTAIAPMLVDPEIVPLLDKSVTDMTAAERQNLTVKLQAANVSVDDAVPDRSLAAALAGLKTAQAFR